MLVFSIAGQLVNGFEISASCIKYIWGSTIKSLNTLSSSNYFLQVVHIYDKT